MRFYFLFLMALFFSCDKTNTALLDKFTNTDDVLQMQGGYSKLVTNEDLAILKDTLVVNDFLVNSNQKYYYGFKKQLDSNHYLITYSVKYVPLYKPTFRLVGWYDDLLCIYDVKNNKIVSKLKIRTSDPILSSTLFRKDIYEVKSFYKRYKYIETEDRSIFENDSLFNKYKIENNKFVEVK